MKRKNVKLISVETIEEIKTIEHDGKAKCELSKFVVLLIN